MKTDFCTIDYLKLGNQKQQAAYDTLKKHKIMEQLAAFDPLLAGTIPIEIDIAESDLDIICCSTALRHFAQTLENLFGKQNGFSIRNHENAVVAEFKTEQFTVEIFGQAIPTQQQNAWRHMLIEHQLLQKYGESFRQKIIQLKQEGYKTEPTFARLLGLKGDPYAALLNYSYPGKNI